MLKGFKQFVLRGNVVDLAVGVVVGAAFTNIVNSIVKGLITPLMGALIKTEDFSGLFFKINGSKFMYGEVLNSFVSFLIIASIIYFFVITPINFLVSRSKKEAPADPSSKKCPECLSEIPIEATRCAHCAIKLPENFPIENV